jgi:hypothetical protein
MNPFKSYNSQEIEMWLNTHPGRVVASYQIAPLMGNAFFRPETVEAAVNDDRKIKIFALQSNIFDEADFIAEGQREEYNPLDCDKPDYNDFVVPADTSPVPVLITESGHKQKVLNCLKKKSTNHPPGPKKAPATQRKKRIRMSSSSSCDEDNEVVVVSTDNEESDDEAGSQYQYCSKYYSENKHCEKRVQCSQCYVWCHEKCVGAERKRNFVCSTCLK